MPDTLPVQLNREDRHSLEVPPAFETADSFLIAVTNHGDAGRIHVHLADDLDEVAAIEENNFYIPASGTTEIPVTVHGTGAVFGKLKLASGYGAVTRWVDVRISDPDEEAVEIDEELATPPEEDDADSVSADPSREQPLFPVLLIGAIALLVAVGGAVVAQSPVVTAGGLLVLAAVVAAGYRRRE